MPSDTSPEAAAIQAEIFRRMTPAERLKMALEMSEEMRQLALENLRRLHPELDEKGVMRELVRLWYGIVLPDSEKSGAP
jgi:hypothetical protein